MPVLAGQQSKFACLKVYDDSESSSGDEGKSMTKATPKKGKVRDAKSSGGKSNGGGLIVHTVSQKKKAKSKKAKKTTPQVVSSDGFIVQDADEYCLDRIYREDLNEAIKNSTESASTVELSRGKSGIERVAKKEQKIEKENGDNGSIDPVELLIRDIDSAAGKFSSTNSAYDKMREAQLVNLYRTRLIDTLKQLNEKTELTAKTEADALKYKNRYKKICELLKDAEVNEKAHLTVELEKARKVEIELGNQIGTLQGELMQARSRIRELEAKLSKH